MGMEARDVGLGTLNVDNICCTASRVRLYIILGEQTLNHLNLNSEIPGP